MEYKGPRDCQNLFAKPTFRYIEVLFHIFYYYWSSEDRSSNRGLHYIEVRYIEVLLYLSFKAHKTSFPFLVSRKDLLKLNTITIGMMTSDVLSEKDKKACYHKATIVATAFRARYFRGVVTFGDQKP